MAVARRGAGAVASSTTTALSVAYPTNLANDVLFLFVSTTSTVTTTPAGWTSIVGNTTNANGHSYVYWRAVTTPITGSQALTMGATGTHRGVIVAYSGASTRFPSNAQSKSQTTASTSLVSASGTWSDYVVVSWVRPAASTMSNYNVSGVGTWTASEVCDVSGTAALAVIDGPTTATVGALTATNSTSSVANATMIPLLPADVCNNDAWQLGAADGTAWNASWTNAGTATTSHQGGFGEMTTATVAGGRRDYDNVNATANAQTEDYNLATTLVTSSTGHTITMGLGDGTGSGARPSNGTGVSIRFTTGATSAVFDLWQMVNGVAYNVASSVANNSIAASASAAYRVRVVKSGNTLMARAWLGTNLEPTTWDIQGPIYDATALPLGNFPFIGQFGPDTSTKTTDFDDMVSHGTLADFSANPVPISSSFNYHSYTETTNTGTTSVPAPTGITPGNVLLAFAYNAKSNIAATIGAPAGWVPQGEFDTGTIGVMSVFTKVATASEPASYPFTVTYPAPGNIFLVVGIHNFSNVDTNNPLSAGPLFGNFGTATTTPYASTLTPTTRGGYEVVAQGGFNGLAGGVPADFFQMVSTAVAQDQTLYTAANNSPGLMSGANTPTGNKTFTGSASDKWVTGAVVLNPIQPFYTASVNLSAAGSLAATGVAFATATGTASLSGTGSLGTSGTPKPTIATAFSSTGALATTLRTPAPKQNVALSASGTLTSTATAFATATGSAALSAVGSLSTSQAAQVASNVALSGTGGLSVGTPIAGYAAAVNLTGSGTLAAANSTSIASTINLSGTGTLGTSRAPAISTTVALYALGGLVTVQSIAASAIVALSGSGALTASAAPSYSASVALSSVGTLASANAPATAVSVDLSASGTLASSPLLNYNGLAGFSSSGTLTDTGVANPSVTVPLSGSGALGTTGAVQLARAVALTGSGTLATTGRPVASTTVALSGVGALGTLGAPAVSRSVALSGSGTLASAFTISTANSAVLGATGALSVGVKPAFSAAIDLSASGTLSPVAAQSAIGTAAFGSTGTLAETTTGFNPRVNVSLSASGVLGAAGKPVVKPTIALSGVGALSTGSRIVAARADVAFASLGSLTPFSVVGKSGTVDLSGEGTLGAGYQFDITSPLDFSSEGLLDTGAALDINVAIALGVNGVLEPVPGTAYRGFVDFSSTGSLMAQGYTPKPFFVTVRSFTGADDTATIQKSMTGSVRANTIAAKVRTPLTAHLGSSPITGGTHETA